MSSKNTVAAITFGMIVVLISILVLYRFQDLSASFGAENPLTVQLFTLTVGFLLSIFYAFTFFTVRNKFNALVETVNRETATLASLVEHAAGIKDIQWKNRLLMATKAYTEAILEAIWRKKRMHEEKAFSALERLFHALRKTRDVSSEHVTNVLAQLNETRTKRLALVQERITGPHWALLFFLSISLVLGFFVIPEDLRLRMVAVAFIVIALLIMLYIIADMDSPVGGEFTLSMQPYEEVLDRVVREEQRMVLKG